MDNNSHGGTATGKKLKDYFRAERAPVMPVELFLLRLMGKEARKQL